MFDSGHFVRDFFASEYWLAQYAVPQVVSVSVSGTFAHEVSVFGASSLLRSNSVVYSISSIIAGLDDQIETVGNSVQTSVDGTSSNSTSLSATFRRAHISGVYKQ